MMEKVPTLSPFNTKNAEEVLFLQACKNVKTNIYFSPHGDKDKSIKTKATMVPLSHDNQGKNQETRYKIILLFALPPK